MKPLHEVSQKRTSWPRSQIVCSVVFLTSKHSVFLHKGFCGHVEFLMQKKVGETETLFLTEWVIGKKKKVGGKEKKKTLLACPLSSSQPLQPKINHMVAQWMILSSLVKCLCWKKVFGVFVKCPSTHKKRQLFCDKVSWIFLSELDSSANALHYFLAHSAPVISSSWKLFVK